MRENCVASYQFCRQGALQNGAAIAVPGLTPPVQFLGNLGIKAMLESLLAGVSQQEQAVLSTDCSCLIGASQ